jgi:multidrug transporter EmrE-like cation transporter
MNAKLMIWISVAMMGILQVVLKSGLTHMAGLPAETKRRPARLVAHLLTQGWFWLWGALFSTSMVLWLAGLRTVDLSYAYPLASLGYVLVSFLAIAVLKERVPASRWGAIAVICAGIWLIARS